MEERMTTWRGDEETILDSDIWRVAKNIEPMSPEEELEAWRTTVRMLDHLCGMADSLMLDPLILALVDAKNGADEELERARERTMRPAGELTEYEEDTLRGLLRRSTALGNARQVMIDHPSPNGDERDLEILEEMCKDATEQFKRYKLEVGLSDK